MNVYGSARIIIFTRRPTHTQNDFHLHVVTSIISEIAFRGQNKDRRPIQKTKYYYLQ